MSADVEDMCMFNVTHHCGCLQTQVESKMCSWRKHIIYTWWEEAEPETPTLHCLKMDSPLALSLARSLSLPLSLWTLSCLRSELWRRHPARVGYLQVLCGQVSCRDAKIGHLLRDGEQTGYRAAASRSSACGQTRFNKRQVTNCHVPTKPAADAGCAAVRGRTVRVCSYFEWCMRIQESSLEGNRSHFWCTLRPQYIPILMSSFFTSDCNMTAEMYMCRKYIYIYIW